MDKNAAEILFNFLRDVLYEPEFAALNLDDFDEDSKMLAEGMQYFADCLLEQRALVVALSKGNLSIKLPSPSNELAAPLKALHASLKHLTWQAAQVAKGDYRQRLDFMGEFAESFNTMTEQLDQRQRALEAEILASQKKTQALEQSSSMLESITDKMTQWIIVVDIETKWRLFANSAAKMAMEADNELKLVFENWFLEKYPSNLSGEVSQQEMELAFVLNGKQYYFTVISYPIHWKEKTAVACVFTNVSAEKEQLQILESYAYQDTLTKLHNRFSGMGILRDWLREKKEFCVCFADLDNLKYVNDNYGHSEGDKYIVHSAELLVNFTPDSVAARLGGDEFMVLVPNLTKKQSEARMDEIRNELIQQSHTSKSGYVCSLSFGVVAVEKDNNLAASDLLSIADERMYEYKRANRIVRGAASVPL